MSTYASAAPALRGGSPARLGGRRALLIVGIGLALIVGVVLLVAAAGRTAEPVAPCTPGELCGQPPSEPPLVNLDVWRSTQLGFHFEYSSDRWKVLQQDARIVLLSYRDIDAVIRIAGAPAGDASPSDLFEQELDRIRGVTLGLADDTALEHRILGPKVGFHDGLGGIYSAVLSSPQGVQSPLRIAMVAGGDSGTSLVASVFVGSEDEEDRAVVMEGADTLLNTLLLKSDARG